MSKDLLNKLVIIKYYLSIPKLNQAFSIDWNILFILSMLINFINDIYEHYIMVNKFFMFFS